VPLTDNLVLESLETNSYLVGTPPTSLYIATNGLDLILEVSSPSPSFFSEAFPVKAVNVS